MNNTANTCAILCMILSYLTMDEWEIRVFKIQHPERFGIYLDIKISRKLYFYTSFRPTSDDVGNAVTGDMRAVGESE